MRTLSFLTWKGAVDLKSGREAGSAELSETHLGITGAPTCLSYGSGVGSCRVGLLDPQTCGAWPGAREGPVLGPRRCWVHVGWGRPTREGSGSVERWRPTRWLEVSESRDQVGGEGSQVVGESQLNPWRAQSLGI